jgi:hypothetical protein
MSSIELLWAEQNKWGIPEPPDSYDEMQNEAVSIETGFFPWRNTFDGRQC